MARLEGKGGKSERGEKLKNETGPAFLATMMKKLEENGGQYMVGKGVS